MLTADPMTDTSAIARIEHRLDPAIRREVEDFIARCPSQCYLQSPGWPQLCPPATSRHDYRLITVREGGRLVGTALARITRLAPRQSMAFLRRGPVVETPQALRRVVRAIGEELRAAGFCSLVLNPRWCDADAVEAVAQLKAVGASVLPDAGQSMHRATLTVDLSGDESALRGRLKQRCRRLIRKAEKAQLSVRPATGVDDAMLYQPVLDEFHARRALPRDNIPPVERMWEMTRDRGGFLLCVQNGQVISGLVFIVDADRAFLLSMASRNVDDLPKNYLLLWEALRMAQAQGFRQFDLAGAAVTNSPDDGARQVADGRNQFKTAFNPRLVELVPMMVLPLRWPAHDILFTLRGRYRVWKAGARAR